MAFPSTFLDLQRVVINKIRLDADADAATGQDLQQAKDWINRAYAKVCVSVEANIADATAVLTAGVGTYTLPPEIIRIKSIAAAAAGSSSYGPPLTESTAETILNRRYSSSGVADTGSTCSLYALGGITTLELWPTPGGADTLLFYYVANPTPLSAGADVPILQEPYASEVLEYGALAEAADFLKDPDANGYRAIFDRKMAEFRTHLRRRGGSHIRSIPTGPVRYPPHDNSVDLRIA